MSYTLFTYNGSLKPVVERYYGGPNGAEKMFFRPSFCANCGVKIERAEWRLWTSRRFCQVCAIELKEFEILPKAVGVLLTVVTIGAVGIAFSSRPQTGGLQVVKQEPKPEAVADRRAEIADPVAQVVAAPRNDIQPEIRNFASTTGQQNSAVRKPTVVMDETPSFCGAETRKGTPCSRRVKGGGRCFQHQGMPSMTVADTQDRKGQK